MIISQLIGPQLESKEVIQQVIGTYGWFVVAAFAAMLFKETLHNFLSGLVIFCGKDIENDDIIYISGRQARVVRVGLRRTIFYMTDRKTKMVVPNEQLKHLTLEKKLNLNGGVEYLKKGSDIGFEEQQKQISDHKKVTKKSEGIF
ncbi:MAG: hypothetical protein CMN79_00555 [Spirochaetales bacterium]|jgi:hypothetical protein|nr:hypothetical protein [Spirochaetales bacterium]